MIKDHLLIDGDDFRVLGVALGQSQSKIIGLRSRVDEKAHRQITRHRFGDPRCTVHDLIVQEAIVGGDRGHLFGARIDYLWVAVTD